MSTKLRILLVDDEPIVGKRLKPTLEKAGYEVDAYVSGSEAIARIGESSYDIVVSDIRIDDVSGIDVLNAVIEKSPGTKVIMISGYATMEVAREALSKGAFDVIAKPFKPGDLRKVVAKAAKELAQQAG